MYTYMQESSESINVFGLYELSSDGTILYTRPQFSSLPTGPEHGSIVGRDFFRDIRWCENIEDLRRRFRHFITGDKPIDSFVFDCLNEQEVVRAKIHMTRAFEHDHDHAGGIVIMDIREAA